MPNQSPKLFKKMRRNIFITGSTGKQGQALISALLSPSDANSPAKDEYHIYALTRNPISPSAQSLAEKYSRDQLTIVQGNLDNVESIGKIFEGAKEEGGIWGVFVVLQFPGLGCDADGEEAQGKMMADLALEHGVQAFLYSSAMRCGPKYESELKYDAKAKSAIEQHCMLLGEKSLPWTILRPGIFMESFDDFIGSVTAAVLKKGLGEETTLGFIASEDIGNVAAGVFRDREKYRHKCLGVVAEYCTISQLAESYQEATGNPMPAIPLGLGWLVLKTNRGIQQELIKSLELSHHARSTGEYPSYMQEVELARGVCKLKTYGQWLKQEKRGERTKKGWNQVSIGRLVMGRL